MKHKLIGLSQRYVTALRKRGTFPGTIEGITPIVKTFATLDPPDSVGERGPAKEDQPQSAK